jgi:hypothetical protein
MGNFSPGRCAKFAVNLCGSRRVSQFCVHDATRIIQKSSVVDRGGTDVGIEYYIPQPIGGKPGVS